MSRSFLVINRKQVIGAVTALAVFIALSAFAANFDRTKAVTAAVTCEEAHPEMKRSSARNAPPCKMKPRYATAISAGYTRP